MKTWWIATLVIAVSTAFVPMDGEAKRLGGGGSQGMQRSLPTRSTPDSTPGRPATPNQATPAVPPTGAATPAAAPRRSWMGPIAGLAAGLGLAALMSHFGLGGAMANFLMIALLAVVAVVAIRFLLQRFGSGARGAAGGLGMAGASPVPGVQPSPAQETWQTTAAAAQLPMQRGSDATPAAAFGAPSAAASGLGATAGSALAIPADFDVAGFQRIAKMLFIRLQAANDAGDLDDLRNFTTPEMFAAVRLELQERGGARQQTDVVRVDAEVLDIAQEAERQIASVRFHGLIREEQDAAPASFDEVWHLVKPSHGDAGWAIAGIQQQA